MSKTQKSPFKIVFTSSLSGEFNFFKVGSLSFFSPLIVSAVSNLIFYIKATEEKTKITTPMFSGSGKNVLSFDYLSASALPKSSGDGVGE